MTAAAAQNTDMAGMGIGVGAAGGEEPVSIPAMPMKLDDKGVLTHLGGDMDFLKEKQMFAAQMSKGFVDLSGGGGATFVGFKDMEQVLGGDAAAAGDSEAIEGEGAQQTRAEHSEVDGAAGGARAAGMQFAGDADMSQPASPQGGLNVNVGQTLTAGIG